MKLLVVLFGFLFLLLTLRFAAISTDSRLLAPRHAWRTAVRRYASDSHPSLSGPSGFGRRSDGAIRITDARGGKSCQNPIFSPDSNWILFTRFAKGYNRGPSEIVRVKLDGTDEAVLISGEECDNVNASRGTWVGSWLTWSSDCSSEAEEIVMAREDGSLIQKVTNHSQEEGSFLEPVFHPGNTGKILFECSPPGSAPHFIRLLELDRRGLITSLTSDRHSDSRLPNWSSRGDRILFQKTPLEGENWDIHVAKISFTPLPELAEVVRLTTSPSNETDNSWAYEDRYILSSSNYGNIPLPNIYAFPVKGNGHPARITHSLTAEDSAPSSSPDGRWIAFESRPGEEEEQPAQIWLLKAPRLY